MLSMGLCTYPRPDSCCPIVHGALYLPEARLLLSMGLCTYPRPDSCCPWGSVLTRGQTLAVHGALYLPEARLLLSMGLSRILGGRLEKVLMIDGRWTAPFSSVEMSRGVTERDRESTRTTSARGACRPRSRRVTGRTGRVTGSQAERGGSQGSQGHRQNGAGPRHGHGSTVVNQRHLLGMGSLE